MELPETFSAKLKIFRQMVLAPVDIDLKGTFNVCRAAFAQLKENRGQILNISATLHYLGTPMQLHVSAAKAVLMR